MPRHVDGMATAEEKGRGATASTVSPPYSTAARRAENMPRDTRDESVAQGLPEPLVGPEVDTRGLEFMPLEVARLRDSDLVAISTGDEFKAAVLLWARSWNELPSGSLPANDLILARAAGYSPRKFAELREVALRGWLLCSDGRLYHPLICDLAEKASKMRRNQAQRASSRWAKERGKKAVNSGKAENPRKSRTNAAAHTAEMQGTGTVRDSESNDSDGTRSVVAALRLFPNGEFNSWNMCLEVLRELGGVSGPGARSFVGKLKSEFKLSENDLGEIAVATWTAKTQDPRSFMRQIAARKGSEIKTTPGADRWAGFTPEQREQLRAIHRERLSDYDGGRGAWDIRANGPKPGEPGCKILPEILREYGFEPK